MILFGLLLTQGWYAPVVSSVHCRRQTHHHYHICGQFKDRHDKNMGKLWTEFLSCYLDLLARLSSHLPTLISHFPVTLRLCCKTSPGANLWYENEFDLRENEPIGKTHLHVNGFARTVFFKQRQKTSQKWPFSILPFLFCNVPFLYICSYVNFLISKEGAWYHDS